MFQGLPFHAMPAADEPSALTAENVGPVLGRLARLIQSRRAAGQRFMLRLLNEAMDRMDGISMFGQNGEHDPRREPPTEPPAPTEQPGPFGDDATSWRAARVGVSPHGHPYQRSDLMRVRLEDGRLTTAYWFPSSGWCEAGTFYGVQVTHYREPGR